MEQGRHFIHLKWMFLMLYFLRGMSMAELDLGLCNTSKSLFLATEHGPGSLPPLGHLWIKTLVHNKTCNLSMWKWTDSVVSYYWWFRIPAAVKICNISLNLQGFIHLRQWLDATVLVYKTIFFGRKNSRSFWKATLHWKDPKAKHSSYHGHSRLKLSKSLENLAADRTLRKFFGEAWSWRDVFWEIWEYSRFDVGCSRSLL